MVNEVNIANQSGVVRVDIADRDMLYWCYLPFVINGGLFVPAQNLGNARYDMGSDLFILMHLVEQNERLPVAGKVVWITPNGAQRSAGVGVQFSSQDNGATQQRIETILAGALESQRPTYTM